MLLDEKTLETIAIAISIAAGCEPCTRYHVKAARELGVGRATLYRFITDHPEALQ